MNNANCQNHGDGPGGRQVIGLAAESNLLSVALVGPARLPVQSMPHLPGTYLGSRTFTVVDVYRHFNCVHKSQHQVQQSVKLYRLHTEN